MCPSVNKEEWTDAEDQLIMVLVQKLGTKWSKIAQMLPGRTDNAIKNHWNSRRRRILRQQLKDEKGGVVGGLGVGLGAGVAVGASAPPEAISASSVEARVVAVPEPLHPVAHVQPPNGPGSENLVAGGWEPFDNVQLANGTVALKTALQCETEEVVMEGEVDEDEEGVLVLEVEAVVLGAQGGEEEEVAERQAEAQLPAKLPRPVATLRQEQGVARSSLGHNALAAATAAAEAAVAVTPQALSEAEVWKAVEAEGLTLVPSPGSQSGFRGVSPNGSRFVACLRLEGNRHHLGRFGTALEAALHVARFLGSDASAAAKVEARAPQQGKVSKKRTLAQSGVVLVDAAGAPCYEVESTLAMRQPSDAMEREFLVRWQDCDPDGDSWKAESSVDERLVQAFALAHQAGAKVLRSGSGASASGAYLPEAAMAKEAAAAMAETHRAAVAKAAVEAAGKEGAGGGLMRCCILGCTEQLLQCNGPKQAGCAVGCAESCHVLCAPCLGRWYTSQADLRDEFGLPKQNRRTCPVCQAELRTAGSEMRGVADQYAMGLQKVAGTWGVRSRG